MIAGPQYYLVVDDDTTNNLICKLTIRNFDKDANITLYLLPEEALLYIEKKYLGTEKPMSTILFLDVNMPSMTGFEFLDEFKKFPLEVQEQFTVYMVSSSMEDFNSQAIKYPLVAGFLSKPLKITDLEKIRDEII